MHAQPARPMFVDPVAEAMESRSAFVQSQRLGIIIAKLQEIQNAGRMGAHATRDGLFLGLWQPKYKVVDATCQLFHCNNDI